MRVGTIRFTLQSLLLLVALSCVVVAWVVQSTRPAEVWYFHLYSTRYNIDSPARNADYAPTRENQCLATIAVSPGIPFYADLPNHYEPTIQIRGVVTRRQGSFGGAFTIWVQDCGTAIEHRQTSPVPMDVLVPFDFDEFYFAISKAIDPYSLDYKIE